MDISLLINKIGYHFGRIFFGKIFKQIKVKKNYIVFESEGDFCDNCRTLYEYMIKNNYNETHKLIWKVKDPKKYNKEKNVVFITSNKGIISSIKFFYYISVSGYFFFTHPHWLVNIKEDRKVVKRKNQKIINLWHGIPIKNASTANLSNTFDYILCSSENTKEWFNKFCGADKAQDIVLGYPRNDILFEKNDSLRKLLKGQSYSKVILCMPTYKQAKCWTDSQKIIPYYIQGIYTKDELNSLNTYLQNLNIILIVKIHHLQDTKFLNEVNLSNIMYVKDKQLLNLDIQLYQFLGQADALLTDYSSVYLDYILLDRPIGFLLEDIEDYLKGRGFLFDNYMDFMPGEKIYTYEDLITFINHVGEGVDDYKEERKKVRDYTNKYQDGNNCKRLLKFLGL